MIGKYKPIGELVTRIDSRNTSNIETLLGISINKYFIPSVANTIGTDLSNYKVIRKNDFAVSLMQVSRDAKIPIACLKEYDEAIMSPAYSIFRVKDTKEVLPDYLDMWFKRAEFDRECAFIAIGGVRGSMPWEEFAEIKVFVPNIDEQEKFVHKYQVISNRIALKQRINDNLESIAQAYFDDIFLNTEDFDCTLMDLAEVNPTRRLEKGQVAKCFDMSTLPTKGCIPMGEEPKEYNGGVRFKNGDITSTTKFREIFRIL